MIADVVVDLQYGDCGKGKVTHYLCKEGNYTHVIRYNGGCNAGHTIYHRGVKFVTHHIPAGVFFNVKSIIGPGCVVHVEQFFRELGELKAGGVDPEGLVFIAKNAHIITSEHLAEDAQDTTIGTTKRGNGPAYRDKHGRTGLRAENVPELQPYLIDIYEELHHNSEEVEILFEGAQGFGLDLDWGDYPYVTSSHCTVAAALQNGVPPQALRHVWGVAKAYETYVGAKKFQGNDPIFDQIQVVGEEYGATTGRKRQVNWMNWDLVKKAIDINGVTHVVFNKMDVLDEVEQWAIHEKGITHHFDSATDMSDWLEKSIALTTGRRVHPFGTYFSRSKETI